MLSSDETISPTDLRRFTDMLRLRDGRSLTLRFVEPKDGGALQSYFRALSRPSRYNRLMGAASELPPQELDKATHVGEHNLFAVVAELDIDGAAKVVGEVRYAFHPELLNVEFGISIDDRFHGLGIASAILSNLECRAAALGATTLFGETLRSNEQMIGLARKLGFEFTAAPDDWKLVRFAKRFTKTAADIPCETWRVAASTGIIPHAWMSAAH